MDKNPQPGNPQMRELHLQSLAMRMALPLRLSTMRMARSAGPKPRARLVSTPPTSTNPQLVKP
jgi:hypothetical protein